MTTKIEGARPFVNTYAAVKCREMRERKREYIYEKLGYSSCKMCGCEKNLEFDHINPSLKTTPRFLPTLSYNKIDKEMYNIQLLCRSCHRKRSDAQQDAAWELFSKLSTSEQEQLVEKHLDKQRKISRGSSLYKKDSEGL